MARSTAVNFKLARLTTALALALPASVWSATPSSGTLTNSSGPLTYSAGPFLVANPTPVPQLDIGPRCIAALPCDDYTLNVSLPPGYGTSYPQAEIRVTLGWVDTGTGKSDYDLWLFRGT